MNNLSEIIESLHLNDKRHVTDRKEYLHWEKKIKNLPEIILNDLKTNTEFIDFENAKIVHDALVNNTQDAASIYLDRNKWKWFDVGECSSTIDVMSDEDIFRCSKVENLPYGHTALTGYFEFKENSNDVIKICYFNVFAKRISERGDCIIYNAIHDSNHNWVTTRASLIKDLDSATWKYCPQTEDENHDNIGRIAAKLLLATLKILQCKNVYIHTESFPERLNKRRKREGKVLGYAKCTIQIKNEEKTIGVSDNQESSGVHQRLHFRRGHIRRLPKGNIWVREYYAGRANIGTLDKDYKVYA